MPVEEQNREFLRVREICGPALARLHETWRAAALTELESCKTDEDRLRCQIIAVIHRDLASQWRDDEADTRETVLNTDRAQYPEGAQ